MADNIDYEELADKTISEIKDTVEDRDEVDYERLLDAEKDNKDRKTMKEWLQTRIDDEGAEEDEDGDDYGCPKCDKSFAYKDALHGHVEEAHSDEEEDEEESEGEDKERHDCPECSKTFASAEALKRHAKEHNDETGGTPSPSPVQSTWKKPSTMFLIGLAIGLAIAAAVSFNAPGVGTNGSAMTPQTAADEAVAYFEGQLQDGANVNLSVQGIDSDEFSDMYVVTLNVETDRGTNQVQVYVTKASNIMFLGPRFGNQPPVDLENGQPIQQVGGNTTQ